MAGTIPACAPAASVRLVDWLLGYPEKALAIGSEALALAERIAHPFSLGLALLFNGMLHLDRGEPELALQRLEAAEALVAEQRLRLRVATAVPARRRADRAGSVRRSAIACLRAGLARPGVPTCSALRAGLFGRGDGRQGEHGAALAAARDGLKEQDETGHGWWDAELHRLEGIALLGLNRLDEGQHALEAALRVAQRQQAKAYELRAATSLARLWRDQGKREEARELLAPVYGWFTEGFDTRDLKEAKALLEELAK